MNLLFIWGWFQWESDANRLEPRTKFAWLIVPLSFLIPIGGLVGFFLLLPILSGWVLALAGIGLACACLLAEYFVVARLLPDRIRRPR